MTLKGHEGNQNGDKRGEKEISKNEGKTESFKNKKKLRGWKDIKGGEEI